MKVDRLGNIGLFILCIAVVIYLFFAIIISVVGQKNETINLNVTGITSSINATSLTSLHFECIKYCTVHSSYVHDCWNECAKLGQELNCMNITK